MSGEDTADVPPARLCTLPTCTREAVDTDHDGQLCQHHLETLGEGEPITSSDESPTEESSEQLDNETETHDCDGIESVDEGGSACTSDDNSCDRPSYIWNTAHFANPESGVWPPELLKREQWMGHVDKRPFAPWSDRDHPDADDDEDARWKWGLEENYADGDTVAIAEDDHRLDGRAFLQQEADLFAFVDGDKVRDPETSNVHPAFVAILEQLGFTYADVSQSGAGVHAYYRAPDGLPIDGKGEATFQIDTGPWGANDAPPTIEIYANKHVCVATGEHVAGTPLEVREWDADVLRTILKANGYADRERVEHDTNRDRPELERYDPNATTADDTAEDVRDILAAVDRLEPRDLPLRTHRTGKDSTGWGTWDPAYRASESGESLHLAPDGDVFHDHKEGEAFGVLSLFAAEEGIISDPWDRLKGAEWWEAVDAARDAGAPIPDYDPGDEAHNTVAALPLRRLRALDRDDARRFARKRGCDWPTTREARDRLGNHVREAMGGEETTVVDAPTSAGKSHHVATTPWLDRPDVTGDAPVVHLAPTRDAREENVKKSKHADVSYAALRGRKDPDAGCPVARGDHDPADPDDPDATDPDRVVTVNGTPASEWLDKQCDDKGVPFSVAHAKLADRQDQGHDELPCEGHGAGCPASEQWDGVPRTDAGDPAVDVVHATHNFGFVPGLRQGSNIILDEQPDYTADLSNDRLQRAVTAFLRYIDAPVTTWAAFVQLAKTNAPGTDAARERSALADKLKTEPDADWYLNTADAHVHAPALARAVFYALADDGDENGRRAETALSKPPRFDDSGGWNKVRVTVVLDDRNRPRTVRAVPDFSDARSVIGLDAWPNTQLWKRNVDPDISVGSILDADERALWRRLERGLTVLQVGDATRPLASGKHYAEPAVTPVAGQLRRGCGDDWRTAVTAKAVRDRLRRAMEDVGVDTPALMHFGAEESRNDFADESVGYVLGCLDPGDDYVLDLLAECGLDAHPERSDTPCDTCDGDGCHDCNDTGLKRAHGRGFVGPDADEAAALLGSVRETHVAQAVGRYARRPDDPEDGAVVFVHTDATPPGLVDATCPGTLRATTDTQQAIIEALRERPGATTADLADAAECTKEHVRQTLREYVDDGAVHVRKGAGEHGRDVYRATAGLSPTGLADVTPDEIANGHVEGPCTWSLAVSPAVAPGDVTSADATPVAGQEPGSNAVDAGIGGGAPPPDTVD